MLKKILRWMLILLGGLAALVLVVALIGAAMPKEHVATRTARFNQPPERLWEVITDHAAELRWRSDLERIEELPDTDGHALWRETYKNGQRMTLETIESVPPRKLVRRIADQDAPFGGSWTIEISEVRDGSRVTLTENGEIYNPIFRFIARLMFNPTDTIDQYLKMLAERFGEELKIEG